jgi:hypothetical protein
MTRFFGGKKQKQIPFGDDNKNGNCNCRGNGDGNGRFPGGDNRKGENGLVLDVAVHLHADDAAVGVEDDGAREWGIFAS